MDANGIDPMMLLRYLSQHGQLPDAFYPYQQEQGVLEQEAAMGKDMQQPGPQHSTPWGALLGGLSDALGKGVGAYKQGQALDKQRALGTRMQGDAVSRIKAMNAMTDEQARNQALLDAINLSPAAML